MGVLMLRCPMTDRNFSTGVNADKSSFRLMMDAVRAARCPQCGHVHAWRPRDAWLMERIAPRERETNLDCAS